MNRFLILQRLNCSIKIFGSGEASFIHAVRSASDAAGTVHLLDRILHPTQTSAASASRIASPGALSARSRRRLCRFNGRHFVSFYTAWPSYPEVLLQQE